MSETKPGAVSETGTAAPDFASLNPGYACFARQRVPGRRVLEGMMQTWKEAWDWAVTECDAWNRRDLEAIMARYAEDVALSSPGVVTRMGRADGWLHGKASVRDYFAIGLQAPGLHFELIDVLFGVNTICMIFRRETGVTVSDIFELDDQDRVVRLLACYGRKG